MWKLYLGILIILQWKINILKNSQKQLIKLKKKKKTIGTALSWTQLPSEKCCNLLRKTELQNLASSHTPHSWRENNNSSNNKKESTIWLSLNNWLFMSFPPSWITALLWWRACITQWNCVPCHAGPTNMARILEWFVIYSTSGPHFVRTLHYDSSVLFAGQEATVRTGHGKKDWLHTGKRSTPRLYIIILLI